MKATIPYVEKRFEEFNRLMFDGRLPMLSIELSDAKTFLGVCVYKKRRTLLGKTVCYDFKLRIMKVIRYDDMGHRKKNGISSSHSFLKEDGIIPPQWKVRGAANKGFRCMGFWKRSMNDSLAQKR